MRYLFSAVAVLLPLSLLWINYQTDQAVKVTAKLMNAEIIGLEGKLTVTINDQRLSLMENGSYTFNLPLREDTALNVEITEQPAGQECERDKSQLISAAETSGIHIVCRTLPGSVSGQVNHYYNGTLIKNARIKLLQKGRVIRTTTTNDQGEYSFIGIGLDKRFTLSVQADNFARLSERFSINKQNIEKDLSLLPAQVSQTLLSDQKTSFFINQKEVLRIDLRHLVREDGKPLQLPVKAVVTVIDPPLNSTVIPGGLADTTQPLVNPISTESSGAVSVDLFDNSGAAVNLGKGKRAKIMIPLASHLDARNAPQIIPLWYFDEQRGYWIEEGFAYLGRDETGSYSYNGHVSHFTTWNADQIN
ncbi:carboxypeptidase-like regulatory domain-containing protein [Psychromonas ossibalaenae]|uniref:carboxypeptidase-like regulatory domain-containing protein n=1 Tax=Psychromonas ossibalaenae TaxID=444922 RepID=UPI0003723510|nr:carboxypeptidase-like regulatory domain-containing protein [Psychromonas ossibalaenae]